MSPVLWRTIVSPIFAENAFVLHLDGDSRCIVVDPGLDTESLFEHMATESLQPEVILNTHGHADHIAGNGACKDTWPDVPLVIGEGDAFMLDDPLANLSAIFGISLTSPSADKLVRDGESIDYAGIRWEVAHTPGHSPGHVVFICKDVEPWLVLGGDVLFREGIGRTDFPGGDPAALGESIRSRLFTLPDDTIILPGHGEPTTIGHEKRHNPFVASLS